MPNPTIALMKNIVRENVLLYEIEYVFYDYIHISPSLLNEFKGFNLRNDEVLLLFSTALKDLAVELNVFVMSSTQLNAKGDDNSNIKNESALAGSRAIINKADIGVIISRPTKEEINFFQDVNQVTDIPNMVTDVYKVRSGEWNQLRIWSNVNLGNLRKVDLFVTDSRLDPIEIGTSFKYQMEWDGELLEEYHNLQIELERIE
jgi:replicative DNA helicase